MGLTSFGQPGRDVRQVPLISGAAAAVHTEELGIRNSDQLPAAKVGGVWPIAEVITNGLATTTKLIDPLPFRPMESVAVIVADDAPACVGNFDNRPGWRVHA